MKFPPAEETLWGCSPIYRLWFQWPDRCRGQPFLVPGMKVWCTYATLPEQLVHPEPQGLGLWL